LHRIGRGDADEMEDARMQLQAIVDGWVERVARHRHDLKYAAPGMVSANAPRTWLLQSAEDGIASDYPRATLNSLRDVEKTSGLYFKNFSRKGWTGGKP
jgi:hypothetical protein